MTGDETAQHWQKVAGGQLGLEIAHRPWGRVLQAHTRQPALRSGNMGNNLLSLSMVQYVIKLFILINARRNSHVCLPFSGGCGC